MSVFLYLRVACDESCPNRRLGKLGVRTRVLETKPDRVIDCVVSMTNPNTMAFSSFVTKQRLAVFSS